MKKLAILSALLLAAIILLPATSDNKYNVSKPVVADGYPLPPCPPPGCAVTTIDMLVADGYPLPPCPPPGCAVTTTGADQLSA